MIRKVLFLIPEAYEESRDIINKAKSVFETDYARLELNRDIIINDEFIYYKKINNIGYLLETCFIEDEERHTDIVIVSDNSTYFNWLKEQYILSIIKNNSKVHFIEASKIEVPEGYGFLALGGTLYFVLTDMIKIAMSKMKFKHTPWANTRKTDDIYDLSSLHMETRRGYTIISNIENVAERTAEREYRRIQEEKFNEISKKNREEEMDNIRSKEERKG